MKLLFNNSKNQHHQQQASGSKQTSMLQRNQSMQVMATSGQNSYLEKQEQHRMTSKHRSNRSGADKVVGRENKQLQEQQPREKMSK